MAWWWLSVNASCCSPSALHTHQQCSCGKSRLARGEGWLGNIWTRNYLLEWFKMMNLFRGACALLSISGTSLLHNIIVLHKAREVEKEHISGSCIGTGLGKSHPWVLFWFKPWTFSLNLLQNLSLAALCSLVFTEQRRIFQITGSCQHYRSFLMALWYCLQPCHERWRWLWGANLSHHYQMLYYFHIMFIFQLLLFFMPAHNASGWEDDRFQPFIFVSGKSSEGKYGVSRGRWRDHLEKDSNGPLLLVLKGGKGGGFWLDPWALTKPVGIPGYWLFWEPCSPN